MVYLLKATGSWIRPGVVATTFSNVSGFFNSADIYIIKKNNESSMANLLKLYGI